MSVKWTQKKMCARVAGKREKHIYRWKKEKKNPQRERDRERERERERERDREEGITHRRKKVMRLKNKRRIKQSTETKQQIYPHGRKS